jgi:hypothetical protein
LRNSHRPFRCHSYLSAKVLSARQATAGRAAR